MGSYILFAAVAALLLTAVTAQCPPGNWTLRGDSCYQWFSNPQYWFDAEQVCIKQGAHLVSVGSENENTLVGRLAQCRDAWIGRFGTNLYRLRDPTSYAWTDGSDAVRFQKHNFTRLDTVHKPLIRSDGEWWLNSLYHERHPFVCEQQRAFVPSRRCPIGWTLFNNHCYLMPEFESNFNEANFYCQGKSSQLVSVLSESELSHINKLTFGIGACRNPLDTVWIGLIKLNPCFPDSGGRELCYQWTDFSGKHLGFPKWHAGHPNNADWTVNCVTLTGDGLRSEICHNRHRFVCKSRAGTSLDGIVAAYDFTRELSNQVDPRTYVVRDDFGVPRTREDGACFTPNSADYYRIGRPAGYNNFFSAQSEWTLFLRDRSSYNSRFNFLALNSTNVNDSMPFQDFFAGRHMSVTRMYLLTSHLEYLPQNKSAADQNAYSDTESSEYFESQESIATRHENYINHTNNLSCTGEWCNLAISMNNSRATFHINEKSFGASHLENPIYREEPDELELRLGILSNYGSYQRYCVRCFGIAHKQLSSQELQQAFATYCP